MRGQATTYNPTNVGITGGTISGVNTTNIAYTVAASGGDYTTVAAAVAAANSQFPATGVSITITVNDGTYSASSAILIDSGMAGKKIAITGQSANTTSLTSVQSSSGSAGAWSIVLNVGSVANIAVGNYVAATSLSGGTNPTYLCGAFKVTNVDAVNTRITVSSKHLAAAAPSGAVAGTLKILKSVLTFTGCDGIDVWNGASALNLSNIVIEGDGTAGMSGLSVQDLGRCYIGTSGAVAVVGFDINVLALYNSQINGGGPLIAAGGATTGFSIAAGSTLSGFATSGLIANGNGNQGFFAVRGQILAPASAIATGNQKGYYAQQSGQIFANSTTATGNTSAGYFVDDGGAWITCKSCTTANNAADYSNGVPSYANNAAAITGGLQPGMKYRSGGDPDTICTVH